MRAGEVMSRGAATVKAGAPLVEAARIMVEHRISGLPVVDANGTLVGIVTERDFLRADEGARPRWIVVLLDGDRRRSIGEYLRERKVSDVMTANPITTDIEAPLEQVLQLMEDHKVRRIPVVSEGSIVGIISRADVIRALVRKTA